jgi:FkbM family methyltransferase
MDKVIRIFKEFVFALIHYSNPLVYYWERFGLFRNKTISIVLRNGIRYDIESGTNQVRMIDEIWRLGVYDPLLYHIRDGGVVVDIGANVGVFTVKAARAANEVRVISYEPFPSNFDRLVKNIKANTLDKTVLPVCSAVSGSHKPVTLYYSEKDSGGVSVHAGHLMPGANSVTVPAVTLSDIFSNHSIDMCDYLKIDCEGAEESILFSAPRELFNKIKSITMEWHADINSTSTPEFIKFLHDLGYEVRHDEPTCTMYAWRKIP